MPKISVIIPSYNRASLIGRAIDSVLNQTFDDYEIIVVDDGSKDNTQETVKPYLSKVKYIYQKNQGVSAARNTGIKESTGEYLAFLDSDDYWAPEKLMCQVQILDENPKVGIVYGRMPIINEKGQRVGLKPAGKSGRNFKELLEVWGDLPTSTVLIRRICFEKVGMFDEALTMAEDTEMWLRISQYWDLHEIEGKELAFYYRHDEQVTKNRINLFKGMVMTDIKILNTYAEIPKHVITQRIAVNEYMLAKEYYNNGYYKEALHHLSEAWGRYFYLGSLFFTENDTGLTKISKLTKPYGFLMICSVRYLFSYLAQTVKSSGKKG